MREFKFSQSTSEITGQSGLALIGQALHRHTHLAQELNQLPLRHGIQHADIVGSYLGLLCVGKNDFEAINTIDSELFYTQSIGLKALPSEATLRQRMDFYAEEYLPVVEKASRDFLKNIRPDLQPLYTGHVPLDADVTIMDNSGSNKEGVSRAYSGVEGYAPMMMYLGNEGYCLELELREGKQHVQRGTPALLSRGLRSARQITKRPLLLRLDGGNDSLENMDVVLSFNEEYADSEGADFIIKWNPRQEDKDYWLGYAEQHGRWTDCREGKQIARFSVTEKRQREGYVYSIRRVMQVTVKEIDQHGQLLLSPEVSIAGWWTSLALDDDEVIALYRERGLSEQFHSEFKTDLDIERLPSGKFATNALVLGCSMLVYNLLRWIGQNGLLNPDSPRRHRAKRRRIKTVMQELMFVAAKMIRSARSSTLAFGRDCSSWQTLETLYGKLASG